MNTLTLFETNESPVSVKGFYVVTDFQIYLSHSFVSDTNREKTDDFIII